MIENELTKLIGAYGAAVALHNTADDDNPEITPSLEDTVISVRQAVADALLSAVEQERISSQETEDRQLYGYNYALDAVTRVIGELGGRRNPDRSESA